MFAFAVVHIVHHDGAAVSALRHPVVIAIDEVLRHGVRGGCGVAVRIVDARRERADLAEAVIRGGIGVVRGGRANGRAGAVACLVVGITAPDGIRRAAMTNAPPRAWGVNRCLISYQNSSIKRMVIKCDLDISAIYSAGKKIY